MVYKWVGIFNNRLIKLIHSAKIFKSRAKILYYLPFLWYGVFFILPCLILLGVSLSKSQLSVPPFSQIFHWDSAEEVLNCSINVWNYLVLFKDSMYVNSFISSFAIAASSTFIALLIGYPMAYAITKCEERWQNILLMLIVMPFWTSFLIRIYAWMSILSPAGILNNFLISTGMIDKPLQLMHNTWAACLCIVYNYLPFMILPLYVSLQKIDASVLEAAYMLGAGPVKTFFKITLPLSFNGVITGCILVFLPAIGEFVIPELVGDESTLTIGRVVWNEFFANISWPVASALSIVLIMLVMIILSFGQNINRIIEENK